MAVSTGAVLQRLHNQTLAGGLKLVNADFALEIEGFEGNWLLCKQAPWPELSSGGEIEVSGPLGLGQFQPQQAKTHQQGAITMMENEAGQIDDMLLALLTAGNNARFNAKVYQGTPENYTYYKPIYDCFMQLDNPDRDWENRSQILLFNGTMFFHYFGEKVRS